MRSSYRTTLLRIGAERQNSADGSYDAEHGSALNQEPIRQTHLLMLRPQGFARIAWDILTMLFLAYLLVSMPYRMGFEVDAEGWELWFERSIDFFFLADVLVRLPSTVSNCRDVSMRIHLERRRHTASFVA